MGDQRRRGGRGRSGRGGRIPRKGEGGQPSAQGESFVSFPLESGPPIRVSSAVDPQAVRELMFRTLTHERAQAESLRALTDSYPDGALVDLRVQVERHAEMLEQLARDLGGGEPSGAGEAGSGWPGLLASAGEAHVGWLTLQRVAHASGDRRIDRVTRPVLREKERHAGLLREAAVWTAAAALFRDPDD